MSRHDWLKLVEVSGPFLTEPVLNEAFELGLNAIEPYKRRRIRSTYEEWERCVEEQDPCLEEIHLAWVEEVLAGALEFDQRVFKAAKDIGPSLQVQLAEHQVTLRPDFALVDRSEQGNGLFIVSVVGPTVDLDETRLLDGYAATPLEQMVSLLKGIGLPLGMVTNGERWCLVYAPEGKPVGYASWYARLWFQEPDTLRAFISLLEMPRFFAGEDNSLLGLYEQSERHQDEVTEALGDQVARAVEVLIQALDRADEDRDRELLKDVSPAELYEAGLTVMMRLVFLMAAEERGLLLLGDPRYDTFYSASNLRMRLIKEDAGVLSTKYEAWAQLLALFRVVFGGIKHQTLRLPALGGSLFDPDRFPFLEGRAKGSHWRDTPADPLPIDDRTVLLLLEAIQLFEGRALSFRALDVEQIGHIYEGLLERTVKRVDTITLDLRGAASAKDTIISLEELETAQLSGRDVLLALLREKTRRSESALRNDLDRETDDRLSGHLGVACHNDNGLKDRVLPFVHLLKADPWGDPIVHPANAFVVGLGEDRRQTGSHYTPKSLTERIVEETLEPVVFVGPREGMPRVEWQPKSAVEILDLKICDPAMGSGAFLVQVCRWLSDRLVEAWSQDEGKGKTFDDLGNEYDAGSAEEITNPLPKNAEDQADLARRLIAEKCLYGVDVNPLAVELAKLSIWLVTMSKGRPFGFLDHNLRSGNSLLGIWKIDQLVELDLRPGSDAQIRLFGRSIRDAVDQALDLRQRIRSTPIRDIEDVDAMAALDAQARVKLENVFLLADAFVGIELAENNARKKGARTAVLASSADRLADGDEQMAATIRAKARGDLAKDEPNEIPRNPFHWPLEFPEVYENEQGGFDAFVGNPPFLGGSRITGPYGTAFRNWLVIAVANGTRGNADLVAYFFLRVFDLLNETGCLGLLAVNTIGEGDTREVGLESLLKNGAVIISAYPNEPWPGSAAVVTSRIHMAKGMWNGLRYIFGNQVPFISAYLSDREEWTPKSLEQNQGITFEGTKTTGMGFVLNREQAQQMLDADPKNADVLFPYINGQDLNSHPEQKPSRYCISFWDWLEERALEYKLPYAHILEHVKPERQRKKSNGDFALGRGLRERWWLHERGRPSLYHAIGQGKYFENHPRGGRQEDSPLLNPVFVAVQTGKYLSISHLPNDIIFSHMTIVFANNDPALFAQLNSTFHYNWVQMYAAKLETRLRYLPSDCFENFPLAAGNEALRTLGSEYNDVRLRSMRARGQGLTTFLNDVNNLELTESALVEFREFQIHTDQAVLAAYGWNDLTLDHGFRSVEYLPENDNVRFTISDELRREVLHRLALLNKERWLAEGNQLDDV
jgi:hypothetical protein